MSVKPQKLTLPLLITRGLILFPNCPQVIEAGRDFSLKALEASKVNANSLILVVSQKDQSVDVPTYDDIYHVGTLCRILSITNRSESSRVRVEPLERANILNLSKNEDYYVSEAEINNIPEADEDLNKQIKNGLLNELEKIPQLYRNLPKSTLNAIERSDSALSVCFILADYLSCEVAKKQELLESKDALSLFEGVLHLIVGEKTRDEVEERIQQIVRESSEKSQKEYFLREKLKAVKQELGEDTSEEKDPENIKKKLEENPYPEHIKKKVLAELNKMDMMPQGSLESSLIQNYIETIMDLPWWEKTEDNEDLSSVEKILDEDHYGLEKAKKRIVEYLAVKKLTGHLKSPILCFYGPPGCGKTSLGRSIARALGRNFFKVSLGGISDEAEIRGHRRTYVGSMPGRIINGMRRAKTTNPVFLLDEIDKLASSYKGDPASALLEVLDPEQNFAFNDNFLEEPYDLSDVLFICTANNLENIPAPLLDRLELIEIPSYLETEKVQIAKGHLLAKQRELNGLNEDQVSFTDDAIRYMIERYTREAGVRSLERCIASCLRKVAVAIVKDDSIKSITVDESKVREYLGNEIFDDTKKEPNPQIGVVTGLAYTSYGGDILPIEVNYFKGKGGFVLTGKLGDVMKESCSIALDYVKSNAERYGIDPKIFEQNDIHIHVPEGAVPKDGPSAGVAITVAIISCLTRTHVDDKVAMTGEVTLRGRALAIGGLREKTLAAARSGIKTVIIPRENQRDVSELAEEVKSAINIVFMDNVDDALKVAIVENQETPITQKVEEVASHA